MYVTFLSLSSLVLIVFKTIVVLFVGTTRDGASTSAIFTVRLS